jgi:hypothetical protein
MTADDALQVGAADHKIDIARQHGMGGIAFFHMNQHCQFTDQFVRNLMCR